MSVFGKRYKEEKLRALELHTLEEMQTVLRLLFGCGYMPVAIRDLVTQCVVWGSRIGEDGIVSADEAPPAVVDMSEMLWEDEATPVYRPKVKL